MLSFILTADGSTGDVAVDVVVGSGTCEANIKVSCSQYSNVCDGGNTQEQEWTVELPTECSCYNAPY